VRRAQTQIGKINRESERNENRNENNNETGKKLKGRTKVDIQLPLSNLNILLDISNTGLSVELRRKFLLYRLQK
tara:strand:- start:164 stop:385 length:222 start_codon:yes stop_codon:yes gene_type:complete